MPRLFALPFRAWKTQEVSLEAKLLDPKDALTIFEGLYTDEFVP